MKKSELTRGHLNDLLDIYPDKSAIEVLRLKGVSRDIADAVCQTYYGMTFEQKRGAIRAQLARDLSQVPIYVDNPIQLDYGGSRRPQDGKTVNFG